MFLILQTLQWKRQVIHTRLSEIRFDVYLILQDFFSLFETVNAKSDKLVEIVLAFVAKAQLAYRLLIWQNNRIDTHPFVAFAGALK